MAYVEADLEVKKRLDSLLPAYEFYVGGVKDSSNIPDNSAFINIYDIRPLRQLGGNNRKETQIVRLNIKIRSDIEKLSSGKQLQQEIYLALQSTYWTTDSGIEIEDIKIISQFAPEQDEQKRYIISTNYELQYYIDLDA